MTQQTTTQNEAAATTETQQAQSAGNTNAEAKFTQADLDRIAGETRQKATQKATEDARKALYAELGIEDPAADKELLAAARKRKADEQSEMEKSAEAATKALARAETAEAALATRNAEIAAKERADALNTAVKDALAKANAKPDKVLKLLRADHADLLDAVLKDDGTVDEKAVTKVVEQARKDYSEDFGRGGVGSPSNANGRHPDPSREGKDAARKELRTSIRSRF